MQGSKIRLSAAEIELFSNAEIILTKNSIVQKTTLLLNEVQENLLHETRLHGYHITSTPKISRGENHLRLPYIVLDYPRISNNSNLFFIRSLFWWGNFFSSTLQVSGDYKLRFTNKLKEAYQSLAEREYFVGVHEDPWQHHFGQENYRKIGELSKEAYATILETQDHIKIAARWPLSDWDSAATKLTGSWKLFMQLIT